VKSLRSIVNQVLAYHVGQPGGTIQPWQELARDLDMTPLEVVLLALEIEGIEGVDIDLTGLELVRTVGELSTFLGREIARARRSVIDDEVA
jgi:hypothetical protein